MKTPLLVKCVGLASLALALGTAASPAAVIGYWRFENAGNVWQDSSGNGYTLTSEGGAARSVLPGSGAGSDFFDPVPQTGAANTAGLALTTTAGLMRAWTSDQPAFAVQDFTIETLVNFSDLVGGGTIAAQAATNVAGNSAWAFQIDTNGTALRLNLSQSGNFFSGPGQAALVTTGWSFTTGVDYYLAASVDFVAGGVDVTFYYQNLTAGGALQSLVVNSTALTSLANSTARFTIGGRGLNANTDAARINGLIDEVRWSNTALGSSELLASVPEPAAASLVLGAGSLLLVLRRVRRS